MVIFHSYVKLPEGTREIPDFLADIIHVDSSTTSAYAWLCELLARPETSCKFQGLNHHHPTYVCAQEASNKHP